MVQKNLVVTTSPHIHSGSTIAKVMRDVIIALIPACCASVYFFGYYVLLVIAVSLGTAVLSEYLWQKYVLKMTSTTIDDLSAAVTGLLLSLTLPPSIPLWQVAIGSVFSIIFAKQIFGGLGHNPFNPALAARAFLQIAWPLNMTTWNRPFTLEVTSATPLVVASAMKDSSSNYTVPTYTDLFLGNIPGTLGETSAAMLLIGAFYLIVRRQIKVSIPFFYILSVALISALYGRDVLFQILAGGLLLGAFFMATDPVTSPTTKVGMIIFGAGCGVLTALIRFTGAFPEGVCYSILIMNMTVPLLERLTIPKPFGLRTQKK